MNRAQALKMIDHAMEHLVEHWNRSINWDDNDFTAVSSALRVLRDAYFAVKHGAK